MWCEKYAFSVGVIQGTIENKTLKKNAAKILQGDGSSHTITMKGPKEQRYMGQLE